VVFVCVLLVLSVLPSQFVPNVKACPDSETFFADSFTFSGMKLISKVKRLYKEKGVCYLIRRGTRKVTNPIKNFFSYYYYRMFKASRTFIFQGERYHYFYHKYGKTWRSERSIEIPIAWDIVKKHKDKSILEVGNVLSHYFSVNHVIIDKYEVANGVINQDVVEYKTTQKYDLIISISTLEHVGWNEIPREPVRVLKAFENLKHCLAHKGMIVVTIPLGYNPVLDELLKKGKIKFAEQHYFKRISYDDWMEVNQKTIQNAKYGVPFPHANALLIGVIRKMGI